MSVVPAGAAKATLPLEMLAGTVRLATFASGLLASVVRPQFRSDAGQVSGGEGSRGQPELDAGERVPAGVAPGGEGLRLDGLQSRLFESGSRLHCSPARRRRPTRGRTKRERRAAQPAQGKRVFSDYELRNKNGGGRTKLQLSRFILWAEFSWKHFPLDCGLPVLGTAG